MTEMNFIVTSKFVERIHTVFLTTKSEWSTGIIKYCLITRISTLARWLTAPKEIVIKTRRGKFKPYKYY